MKTDGKLRQLPSGEWAIQAPGREPVRIVAGEVYMVEVAGKMKRTRLAQRADGKYHSTTGVELCDGMRAGFYDGREWHAKIKGDTAKDDRPSAGGTLARVRLAYDKIAECPKWDELSHALRIAFIAVYQQGAMDSNPELSRGRPWNPSTLNSSAGCAQRLMRSTRSARTITAPPRRR
jgi:hypothetical protein